MVPPRPRACCRRDVANHDGDYSRPWPAAPARQLRSARAGADSARSGPSISGPSSISLPGLNLFPTSRVGPSSSVDRNRGAERKADHPRREFQFPGLRLKSTRRLADRRSQPKNCKFFFRVERSPCRNPFWSFLPNLVTSVSVYRRINTGRPLMPQSFWRTVVLRQTKSSCYARRVVPVSLFSYRRSAPTWKPAVLEPSDPSTTAANTLFSSETRVPRAPEHAAGFFCPESRADSLGYCLQSPDHEAEVGESLPCLRITLNASSPSGKPTGIRTGPFAPSTSIGTAPSSTSWTCFPTPAVQGCTWAIRKAIPRPTSCA